MSETNNTYFELKAKLDQYAGNHERELTYWVFGAKDDYDRDMGDRPHAASMLWAYDEDSIDYPLTQVVHDEYGVVWQDLDLQDPNTIVWRFGAQPDNNQWAAMEKAFHSYKGAKILNLSLTMLEIEVTSTLVRY